MYTTVRRYENVTDPRQVARIVQESFLPIVSDLPGFVAYYFVDAGAGAMVSISVFQSKEGAEESNRRAAVIVREKLASMMPASPQITEGEVVATKAR
jgi:hypothetical protein